MSPQGWREWVIWALFYFVLLAANGWLSVYFYKKKLKRRGNKFMKWVHIQYPESTITYVAVDSSDEETLRNLRAQVEEGLHDPRPIFRKES